MPTIDYTATDERNEFDVVPPGTYVAAVTASDIKHAKANASNRYLELVWEIQRGDYQGRQIWHRLNLWNSNAQAAKIARAQMNEILQAVGLTHITESEALHDIPLLIAVKVRPAKGDYQASNEIARVASVTDARMAGAQSQAAANPPANRVMPQSEPEVAGDIPF